MAPGGLSPQAFASWCFDEPILDLLFVELFCVWNPLFR